MENQPTQYGAQIPAVVSSDLLGPDKINAAKRLGIQRCDWMGDWWTAWSPRNHNENGEGTWHHWANLAAMILADPRTKEVAPELYRPELKPDASLYSGGNTLKGYSA